jgi:hypothetical protein
MTKSTHINDEFEVSEIFIFFLTKNIHIFKFVTLTTLKLLIKSALN